MKSQPQGCFQKIISQLNCKNKELFIKTSLYISTVTCSPDNKYIASAGCRQECLSGEAHGLIKVWDIEAGLQVRETLEAHMGLINQMSYSPCSRFLISGSEDKTVKVWNLITHGQMGRDLIHEKSVLKVSYSAKALYIITFQADEMLSIWNPKSYIKLWQIQTLDIFRIPTLDTSPLFQQIIFWNQNSNIVLHDIKYKKQIIKILFDDILTMKFSRDGQVLYILNKDRQIIMWNITFRMRFVQSRIDYLRFGQMLHFSPDLQLLIQSGISQIVEVWKVSTGQILSTKIQNKCVTDKVEVSMNGIYLFVPCSEGIIEIISTTPMEFK